MTAFEVSLNERILCIAGIEGPGTISLIASWVRGEEGTPREGERLELNVCGIDSTTKEYADWVGFRGRDSSHLTQGDEIRLRVIESREITTPNFRPLDTLQQTRLQKELYLQELARELGWTVIPPEPMLDQAPAEPS